MLRKLSILAVAGYVVAAMIWVALAGVVRDGGKLELLNVACDPTRELWRDVNAQFEKRFERDTGIPITIKQSHGGSGSQAGSVINGLKADIVTLALWTDTDAIRKAGIIDAGWEDRFPNRSLPFTSTIVFVVRKGNPKQIRNWDDLNRDGVSVITPNPKTSGNGKWSFLAMWGYQISQGKTDAEALRYVTQVIRRVPIRDASARGATMTFAHKKIGDVHLTWENEAYLEVLESNGDLEIVYPPSSVLAEPHVAVVDRVARKRGTKAAADAYLNFLYTEEAQEVIAHHYYRPTNEVVRKRTANRFPSIELFSVRTIGASWDEINSRFFAEGAIFDSINGVQEKSK